ncbi:hypothetical protein SRABI106_01631 [Rahnella aquatilis]|nr:hypothetical protein SRABI106_01631 [Rahnella aquatilis]
MKDYSTMSDDEIAMEIFLLNLCESARALAIARGLNHYDVLRGGGEWSKYDPCNNPADAWPIIVAHKINIDYRAGFSSGMAMAKACTNNAIYATHHNVLRAAMIVYLMMKDAEKGHG